MDTGIDINHESIAGRTVPGWDFVNQDDSIYDMDAIDKHGTYVASIIAGSSSTLTGVAPGVKIMPLKAFTYNYGYTADIIDAIQYAKDKGIKIINCSFAGGDYNSALADVMNDSGILFVCAAGNYAVNTSEYVTFPACFAFDNIISVAAVTNTGELADFTTYGDKITLSAPGKDIYGAAPENKYEIKSGTSVSAAYVSGAAALMLSNNQNLSASEMKTALKDSAKKSSKLSQAMALNDIRSENSIINPLLDVASALKYESPNSTAATPEPDEVATEEKEILFEAVNGTEIKIHFDSKKEFVSAHIVVAKDETVYTNTDINSNVREFSVTGLSISENYTYNIVFSSGDKREDWLGTFQLIQTDDSVTVYDITSSKQEYQIPQNLKANAVIAQKGDVLQPTLFERQTSGVTPYSTDRYEQENNNSISLADRMYDGDNMWGAISSKTDVDYYKISFTKTGVANFWLGNIPSGCYYTFQILNTSGTVLGSAGNAPYTTANRYNFNVTANTTYYIKVFGVLDTYSSSNYLLRAKWYPAKDEYEDNDSIAAAKLISLDESLRMITYATINHPYDIDYYKFTIDQDMYVSVAFTPAENTRYEFRLMDENMSAYINTSTTIDSSDICTLASGTYYLQVNGTEAAENYSQEEYFIGIEFAPIFTLSAYNSTRTETMSPNGVYFEIPFINEPRGAEFILTNPSGVNYDMFLYEGYETEIASAVTKKETEKISVSLTFGGYFLYVNQAFGVHALEDFTLQTKYVTVGNSSVLFNNGDSIPERMEAGTSKAVSVAASNTGANIWTKADGYSLRATGQNSMFGAGANQNLSDSAAVQYSKGTAFYFNLTAPIPSSGIKTYSLGWRMQQNGVAFGDTLNTDIDVFDPETLMIGSDKYIAGPTEKWYKITFPTAGAYTIRTYGYSLGCDTDLEIWSETLGGVSFCKYANDVSTTNLYSKLTVLKAQANQTVLLQVKEHNGSNLYTKINVTKCNESTIGVGETVSVENVTEGYIKFTPPSYGTYVFYTSRSENGPDCDTYLTLRNNLIDYSVLGENDDVGAMGENDDTYSGALYSKITMYVNSLSVIYIQPTNYEYYKCGKDSKTNCTVTVKKISDDNITDQELNITSPSNNSKMPVGSTIKITGNRAGYSNVSVTVNGVKLTGMTTTNQNFEVDYIVNSIKNYNIVLSGTSMADNTVVSKSITIQGVANLTPGSGFNDPTMLAEGVARTFDIDSNEDAHYFSFTPSQTGSYIIKSMDVPGENLLDMAAELYDSDKTTIIDQSDNAPDSVNFMLARTLEKNKKYYIKAYTSPFYQKGKYTIMAQRLVEPNDEGFGNQWGLLNKGNLTDDPSDDFQGVAGVDINILPAWQYTKGEGVTVAVVDSGVDTVHEDLSGNLLPGYNFVHNTTDVFPVETEPIEPIDSDIDDAAIHGHGTHVSGIIAAESAPESSTNPGIIGVAPNAKILPVKVLGNVYKDGKPTNANTRENLIDGINYAAQADVKIINLSVGGYRNAIIATTMKQYSDTLFIVSAGNDGTDLSDPDNVHYPACAEGNNIITVANMRGDGELAPDSCYGGPTQLAAPGSEIYSTMPSNNYGYMSGTSMAAPHVSGVAALLLSYDPSLTANELRSRIINNVTVSEKLEGKVSSGGYLNAFRALTNEADVPSTMAMVPALSKEEESEYYKNISNREVSSISLEEKTNEIFINFMDNSRAETVMDNLLADYNYQIKRQIEPTNTYLLSFDSVEDAESAIGLLNDSDDIYFSCMNLVYLNH